MKKAYLMTCAAMALTVSAATACTAVLVGKKASTTGRVILGHNEDNGGRIAVRYGYVPARDWPAGSVMPSEKGLAVIPQVPHTLGFFWSELKRPSGHVPNTGTFLNERGVMIVSDNAGRTREDLGDATRLTDGGIHQNLRRAVGERATSARDAVRIIGELVEKWGYVPAGRIYTVADANEGWMVQVVSGRHWVARRCPDDAICVVPNHYTIHKIPPKPTDTCMFSHDLVDYAVSKGWWNREKPFDFALAYQRPDWVRIPHNTWRQTFLTSQLLGIDWHDETYPFSVKATRKISPEDVKKALSAHPEKVIHHNGETDFDSPSACRFKTNESLVCDFGATPAETVLHVAGQPPCETGYSVVKPLALPLPASFDDHRAAERLARYFEPEPDLFPKPLVIGLTDPWDRPPNAALGYYIDGFERAGHIPVVIGLTHDAQRIEEVVSRIDVLVLTGGGNVNPARYGEECRCGKLFCARDEFEVALIEAAKRRGIPMLGICRGLQMLNVAFGGSLYQNLVKEYKMPYGKKPCSHKVGPWDKDDVNPAAHDIFIEPDSRLHSVLGTNVIAVNSHHGQGVKRLAPGWRVSARAPDGFVEAIECDIYPAAAVQFHPEALVANRAQDPRFDLVRLAAMLKDVKKLTSIEPMDSSSVTVRPPVLEGALRNPMKGFIPHIAELSYSPKARPPLEYVTLVRHCIKWSDLEDSESDGVEKIKAYCDEAWKGLADRNIKVIPRVYLQWSGPKWAKGDPKKWWQCWPKDMTAGDWESGQFKDRVRKMAAKLGACWDNDPRVAWVQMGIMGAWGEHHAPSFTPDMEKVFGDAFTAAFKNKKVTVRRPEQFADCSFGVYVDNWGDRWFWDFDNTASAAKLHRLVMDKRRQMFAPIEGEIAYGYPSAHKARHMGENGDDTLSDPVKREFLLDTIRYFGGSALGWINRYTPTNEAIRTGATLAQKAWGYRYEIDAVTFGACVRPGGELRVDVKLHNSGSAPFYYRWPVVVSLLDIETRKPVWTGDFHADIRTWLPGEDWNITNNTYATPAPQVSFGGKFSLPSDVKCGRYVLALAVLDLAGMRPSLRFATKNHFKGGWSPIGCVTVGERPEGPADLSGIAFDDPCADDSLSYDDGCMARVVPARYPSGLRNPMKGFIPHLKELTAKKARPTLDYVTLTRHYIKWSDLEETESDGVEKIRAYCDKAWKGLPERNIKVIPRVILQWSGPKWSKAGDWWQCWPKDMTAGDWESEQFKDRVCKMVRKLGECWDVDPRVAWVNMAIMGAWGEHHAPSFTPEMEKVFGDAFTAAFRNKKVTVRQGNQFANYSFGIDWCAWADHIQWTGKSPQYAHWMRELVKNTRRQMFAPFEGEIVYAWPAERLRKGAGVTPDDTLSDAGHLAYVQDTVRILGGTALGWVNKYNPTNTAIRVGASELQKTFGYRYEVDEVSFDRFARAGERFRVNVRLRNTGSAPFYYRWPVTVALLDQATHSVVHEWEFDADIRTWLPGEGWSDKTHSYANPPPPVSFGGSFVLPKEMKDGRYILALSVLDPAGRQPSLRFAVRNYFRGGRHPIGYFTVGAQPIGSVDLQGVSFDDPNGDVSLRYTVD